MQNQGDSCEWRILATHGEKIILNITQLDIPAISDLHLLPGMDPGTLINLNHPSFFDLSQIMPHCRVQRQQPPGGARRVLAPLQAARPPVRHPLLPAAHRLHGEQDAHHVQDGGQLGAADWLHCRLRRWALTLSSELFYVIHCIKVRRTRFGESKT